MLYQKSPCRFARRFWFNIYTKVCYNEFIVFWVPQMQKNSYNLITFQKGEYTDCAVLEINPKPDNVLRVFMVYQALNEPIEIEAPEIEPFERSGFTVIEWGGCEWKN